jgi:hypothetical protein
MSNKVSAEEQVAREAAHDAIQEVMEYDGPRHGNWWPLDTLDNAIDHFNRVRKPWIPTTVRQQAECAQLCAWLRELKRYREIEKNRQKRVVGIEQELWDAIDLAVTTDIMMS